MPITLDIAEEMEGSGATKVTSGGAWKWVENESKDRETPTVQRTENEGEK